MWPSRGDVAEAVLAGGLDDRLGDEQGNGLVAVGGERLQVAVVVVLVADQHAVKPGKVGNADGDRLALVVAGPGAEPRVGQEGAPADLDQVAAVGDAGDRGLRHRRCPRSRA
jgi:hypothetical protein